MARDFRSKNTEASTSLQDQKDFFISLVSGAAADFRSSCRYQDGNEKTAWLAREASSGAGDNYPSASKIAARSVLESWFYLKKALLRESEEGRNLETVAFELARPTGSIKGLSGRNLIRFDCGIRDGAPS
ncbi:predicted protein [Coccidioides posadasii str. Silveira]|uniref:Predicted protein n=1 Tax=Coccidioides posadasii (strain RMSCC 757 / Silveira) TaxID=443226 RepID=E9DG98_COCPS|nr:predicted protein [Coccidioides posadasii str. Silveira]